VNDHRYNPGLHRVALLTSAATFPLIFMGGLVTSHGAGMSVPDWPNSYGYNMFLFPPRLWVGGILYEHTHRLMGTVVGVLSIVLCAWAWKVETRRWVRWLATGVLGAVIVQGVLGGLRVVMVELDLAIVHACFAQAFFCLTALTCVVTSRWWIEQRASFASGVAVPLKWHCLDRAERNLIFAGSACVVAVYLQLVVGATMRHYGAGLAIPDLPLAYGKVLPPLNSAQLADVNALRTWTLHEQPVTLPQVWLHFGHRAGAVVVSAVIISASILVIRRHRDEWALLRPALAMLVLLVVQVTLGVLTVLMKKPADVASAHVAVGALTLVSCFVLTARAARLYARRTQTASRPANLDVNLPEAAAVAA
jgi:cytochrome c oxidase assembly protein subunit 15